MATIQPALTPHTVTAAASTTTTPSGLTAVQVEIADISQALQNLTRAIQTSATPAAAPVTTANGTTLTLATALGNITVTLPQLSAAEQQNLMQLLTALAQAQRPLTLGLQPGSPPTQAVLLIPASAPAAAPPNPTAPAQIFPLPAVTVGETLPAVVLPNLSQANIPSSVIPSPAFSPPTLPSAVLPPANNAPPFFPAAALPDAVLQEQAQPLAAQPQSFPATASPAPNNPAPVPVPSTAIPIPAANIATPSPQAAPVQPVAAQISLPQLPQTQATPLSLAPAPAPLSQPAQPMTPLAYLLQPGNEVTLRVDAILPPAQTTPVSPLAANQIVATVTGTGTDGQIILKAGDATLFVKAAVSAPVGSSVVVTVEAAKTPLMPLPSLDPVNFQALPQALATLAQIDPQILQQMIAHLPQPTESLPGALLFLFSAFKQGNVRGWLGNEVTDSLMHAGKYDIVNNLSRELGGAGQTAQDAVVGQWRSYPIPLYSGAQFQALTLYVHDQRDARHDRESGTAGGANKIRFLIDMRLSRLGAMQIDGFVQPKKLDMILRSENRLPEGLHHELRASYVKALGAVGYGGSLHFQVGRQFWLSMQRKSPGAVVT